MSDSILVTGGAGFIGSNLVDRLVEESADVICLDNFDPYYPEACKRENIAGALRTGRVRLYERDIRDYDALARLLAEERPSAVVHLAARPGVRPSLEIPEVYLEINIRGTLNVLSACRAASVTRVVFASSSSVYGSVDGAADERTTPCRPLSPYGASKVAGEALCSAFAQTGGLAITALRFFTVYGPRQRPDMAINKFARKIAEGEEMELFGDGTSLRDYTYVDDIVSGIVGALDRTATGYDVFNLGGSAPVRLLDLVGVLEQTIGRPARIRFAAAQPGDPSMTFADIRRARDGLGFRPTTPIDQGIARYVSWLAQGSQVTS